jgi:hypothetical protein
VRTPRPSRRHGVAAAPSGSVPRRAHVPMTGRAGHMRLGTTPSVGGGRCPDFKVLGGGTCSARCHRNKKNLHAILPSRSGSELVSLPDRILLLIACRPRARVMRACAVGVGRQTGSSNRRARSTLQSRCALVLTPTWMQMSPRATAPGYRRSRRPRSPASRNGTGHLPNVREPRRGQAPKDIDERGAWAMRAGWAGWMGRACDAR